MTIMKTKKSLTLAVLPIVTAIFLLSPSALAATTNTLTLGMGGIITNAGDQHYALSGGQLLAGSVFGQDVSGASVSYNVNAVVAGLQTHGSGSLAVSGSLSDFKANIQIMGEVPAAIFPLNANNNFANCDPSSQACNSEIPLLFTGIATIHMGSTQVKLPIAIESAYWNPFGGPIVITSLEDPNSPAIFLVVTYNNATIEWQGVQLQGMVGGVMGPNNEPVAGYYTTVSNSHEDLVAAIEQDSGLISFAGMSPSSLNVHGTFSSITTFSLDGSMDCSPMTGLPEGTCTATGASSLGSFQMNGAHGVKVSGSFSTTWSVPSLTTTTDVIATVTQP
jgi:hypothetical protein